MEFSILARNGLCSLMICWLLLVSAGVLCLSPSSPFFFSSGKGFCSIMICWFLLVPAGVPVLVSLLLSLFFPQDRGSVSSWFAGSSWFRLGFRCLSPFFSLLSFLRKGVLFHHDLLVFPGSGWGSGACLPYYSFFFGSGACLPSSLFFLSSEQGFCSIMIYWFLLVPAGVPVLVSLLLSSLVPVLVSLLLSSFFPQERGSVPSWFAGSRLGFRCLSVLVSLILFSLVPVCLPCCPSSLFFLSSGKGFPSWFAGFSWFRLGFRCLSPLLFFLFWFRCLSPFFSLLSFLRTGVLFHHDLLVPPGSGWGSGACLPSSLFFGSGACIPSSLFSLSSGKGFLFHHDLLVPPGSGWGSVPSWFLGSSWCRLGSGACLPSSLFFLSSGQGFCFIMICWLLLVPAGVPVLVSTSSLFFGSGVCLPSSLFFLSSGKGFCSIMIYWFVEHSAAKWKPPYSHRFVSRAAVSL